jgi:hypothetical protein
MSSTSTSTRYRVRPASSFEALDPDAGDVILDGKPDGGVEFVNPPR